MTVLKTAIATYPHTKGLKDGTVSVPGVQFEHIEVSPIIGAFRRMCRTLEFDVCEMAITTYLTAKAYDKPFTALPVFVVSRFSDFSSAPLPSWSFEIIFPSSPTTTSHLCPSRMMSVS